MKVYAGNHQSNLLFLQMSGVLSPGMRILEIGSGTGAMVYSLKEMGYEVQGIEPDGRRIETGQGIFGDLGISQMNGEQLDFADNSFDVVMSFDVFEHIPDSDAHLREVYRVLTPGGAYLLGTPNKITNVPWEVLSKRSFRYREYHCSLHTRSGLRRRLRQHAFRTRFMDIPVFNDFTIRKVKRSFGPLGALLFEWVNPDRLPGVLRTNFYVVAWR